MHQRLRVDRPLGHGDAGEAEPLQRLALVWEAGDRDGGDVAAAVERGQAVVEDPVLARVVERPGGGRAGDHDEAAGRPLDPELGEDLGVGLEAAEVDLLLEPLVALHLARDRSLAADDVGGDRLGQEDAVGAAEGEVVGGVMLVVHRGHGRDAERAGGDDLRERVVREGDVGALGAGEPAQQPDPGGDRERLAVAGRARVADADGAGPTLERQLLGLGVVAVADHDLVAALGEALGDRAEQHRLRRVGDVDPDLHARTSARRSAAT